MYKRQEYDQRAKDDAVTPIGQLVGGDLAPENESDCVPQAMVQDTACLLYTAHCRCGHGRRGVRGDVHVRSQPQHWGRWSR